MVYFTIYNWSSLGFVKKIMRAKPCKPKARTKPEKRKKEKKTVSVTETIF